MKYAWWVFFFIVVFLFCTQRVAAVEVAGFDPNAPYVVHSTPFVVPDFLGVTPPITPTPSPKLKVIAVSSVETQSDESDQNPKTIIDVSYPKEPEATSIFSKVGASISSVILQIKSAISLGS